MRIHIKQNKFEGLRIIREKAENNTDIIKNLKLIFIALSEMSYDYCNTEFTMNWNILCKYSALSKTTIKRYIHILENFGLIENTLNKKKNTKKLAKIIQLNLWQEQEEIIKEMKLQTKIGELILQAK